MRIDSASEFVDYWQGVRQRTWRVIEHVRAEDLEWTYAPERWTIGDLVRHLAGIERDMYAENVSGRPLERRSRPTNGSARWSSTRRTIAASST